MGMEKNYKGLISNSQFLGRNWTSDFSNSAYKQNYYARLEMFSRVVMWQYSLIWQKIIIRIMVGIWDSHIESISEN
jgi:hypothetical protein